MDRAVEQERHYDWLGAAETYEKVLKSFHGTEPLRTGDILELRAYALYKRALQAENVEEFGSLSDKAAEAYGEAKTEYVDADSDQGNARTGRCDSMLAMLQFLRAATVDERRQAALEAWDHARASLDAFATMNDMPEFCRTYCEPTLGGVYYSNLVRDYEPRKKIWTEMIQRGEKAAAYVRGHTNRDDSVRILVLMSALLCRAGFCSLCEETPQHCNDMSSELFRAAESVSYERTLSSIPMVWFVGDIPIDPKRESAHELVAFRKALELVRATKDRFIVGHALAGVSFYTQWIGSNHPDKELGDGLMDEALASALEAKSEFMKIGFLAETGHNMWVMAPHAEYWLFKAYFERDLKSKREYAEKALDAMPEYSEAARQAGYSWQIFSDDLMIGQVLWQMAKIESNMRARQDMLQKAVEYIRRAVESYDRWDSGNPFNLGVWHNSLADAQGDLAEATEGREPRALALRDAIAMYVKSLEVFQEGAKLSYMTEDLSTLGTMGWSANVLGRRYLSLFEVGGGRDSLKDALKCFERASELYHRSGDLVRAAENLWEAAKVYDLLDEPVKASERFQSASKEFKAAANKIPRLKGLFSEQAAYLEAWAEFEKAKHHHSHQEYQQARSHFEKAASMHDGLEKWQFLASNYRAWALIDSAEALSREDRRDEASKTFEEATLLFEESKADLEEASQKAENADEKRMISRLLVASGPRGEYCLARAMIEKARQMDVDGMSSSSSELYKTAADELERLAGEAASERDRTDIRLLAVLSRAWQKMNQAEADVSPEPYADAALLFEEAKELSTNDKAKALSLGHSRFCKALEAGTRFADTRESALHATAIKSLESASSFYVKAGADRCSEYARASKLLFDAYAYLAEASQEKNQGKAAKIYAKAEKVLQASSESYDRAGQAGKRDQVLKHLDRVKMERELAVSLMEVFEAPTGASSTAAFGAPRPSQEEAVGLDRFAHADIQAALIVKRNDIRIGEDVSIEIELVNAGRASAQLTKVENLIPAGFDVLSKPATYRIEDSYIMMKGKRLGARGSTLSRPRRSPLFSDPRCRGYSGSGPGYCTSTTRVHTRCARSMAVISPSRSLV